MSTATAAATDKRYLTRADVCALLGYSRWTLRRKIVTGEFPRPTCSKGKTARWPTWLVTDWAEGRRKR